MASQVSLMLIIGLPGAGKTTLAGRFSALLGWPIITTESIGAELSGHTRVIDDRDFSCEELALTYRSVYLLTRHLLSAGVSVIVDGVFRSEEQRQSLMDIAKELDAHFLGIHAICLESIAIERVRVRKAAGTVSPAGSATYQKLKAEFQPVPGSFIQVDTSSSLLEHSILPT